MLKKLIINNYVIIDRLIIEPDEHLNIVTGETGAGKSIILGAMSLILGDRADTTVLINKDEKCVVEAYFDVKDNEPFLKALKEADLDNDPVCIIRREINAAGKSRAFINDTPVTLNILNNLTSLLVDLHQQFGHLALENNQFQMDVLDAIAQNGKSVKDYSKIFEEYRNKKQELLVMEQTQAQWAKEADYKLFLYNELVEAQFKENEIEEADKQLKQIINSGRILNVLQDSVRLMEQGERPLLEELKRIALQLRTLYDVMPDLMPLSDRILSSVYELKDVTTELEKAEGKVNVDQDQMWSLQARIDVGYTLFKKHGVNSTNELLAIKQQLSEELKTNLDLKDSIELVTKELDAVHKQLQTEAAKISKERKKVAPVIEEKINELLALVGMPNARLKITTTMQEQPSKTGIDVVQFLFDANKSGQFQPVEKAASGGELSRIMLCIKSMTAKAMAMPTLIFDEVDAGISGEAARQVGILLKELSLYHQVICITHQAQVAAKGSTHFHVYKEADVKGRITTRLKILTGDERVLAIAKMIGGEQPSDAAMQNARELVTL